jgi:hypothetical protein
MSNNELFPFPGQENEKDDESLTIKPDLPSFPTATTESEQLTATEIQQVRQLLKVFNEKNLAELLQKQAERVQPVIEPDSDHKLPESNRITPQPESANFRETMFAFLDSLEISETWESETRNTLKALLNEISEEKLFIKVWGCIIGVFPAKSCLRHGTPEQKLFALIAIGDRFLQAISKVVFAGRKRVLKTIAAYLSAVSEQYNFIQMENENFSPQYHERIPGSSATGRTIKEMHGFLVVGRQNNQVVRTGRVLT